MSLTENENEIEIQCCLAHFDGFTSLDFETLMINAAEEDFALTKSLFSNLHSSNYDTKWSNIIKGYISAATEKLWQNELSENDANEIMTQLLENQQYNLIIAISSKIPKAYYINSIAQLVIPKLTEILGKQPRGSEKQLLLKDTLSAISLQVSFHIYTLKQSELQAFCNFNDGKFMESLITALPSSYALVLVMLKQATDSLSEKEDFFTCFDDDKGWNLTQLLTLLYFNTTKDHSSGEALEITQLFVGLQSQMHQIPLLSVFSTLKSQINNPKASSSSSTDAPVFDFYTSPFNNEAIEKQVPSAPSLDDSDIPPPYSANNAVKENEQIEEPTSISDLQYKLAVQRIKNREDEKRLNDIKLELKLIQSSSNLGSTQTLEKELLLAEQKGKEIQKQINELLRSHENIEPKKNKI